MPTYPTQCPSPVTPTVTANTQYWTDGEVTITVTETDDELVQDVAIQVVDPGYWLVYIWFIDDDTITEENSLTPPTTPGISNFYKVSDSAGLIEFEISNEAVAWSGNICAVVVGSVNRSDAIVVGV